MKTYMQPPMKKSSGGIMSIIEDEGDSYEDRTPENIEILTNNLRGDVRSMDDRYAELAQMVGEEQAAQTPPEVVALFQTRMTTQQPMPPVPAPKANGIAGLMGGQQQAPQQVAPGQPQMPPQDQMPPGAPPTPTGEPPVQRQLGSGPSAEVSAPKETYGNFRIDITGVGEDTPNDLQEVDSFVQSFQSQGGDINKLLKIAAQPQMDFEESKDIISGYLGETASSLPSFEPQRSGLDSLLAEKSISSTESGAGLGKILSAFGKAFGGSEEEKPDPLEQYRQMMKFASPANPLPVRRQLGSGPMGERVEPTFGSIPNTVGQGANGLRANDPFNLPSRGVPAMPPVPEAFVNPPTSRPLTQAELAERVAAGERRTLSPATRTLYELARQNGIDPVVLTKRLSDLSNSLKKVPGIGKLFRSKEAFKLLGSDLAVGATAAATGAALLRPNDGVVPPVPPSQFGVEQIPTEFDTAAKPGEPAPAPPSSPPDDPAAIGGPVDLKALTREVAPGSNLLKQNEVTPIDTFEYDENILKEQQAAEQYAPGAERDTSGPALEAAAAKEDDDAYATAVRKRAKVYQDLLGDSKEDRQMKAYLLLAEAGLKMMTGKGRNTASIVAQGLQGLPSGLGKIAEQSSAIKRAATSAAISDVNAQELAKIKADRTLLAALYKQQIEAAPRLRKVANTAQLIAGKEGVSADDPFIQKVAESIVDGTIKADSFGNYRGPDQSVLIYGESTKLKPSDRGYIPANSPFLKPDPARPIVVQTEPEMAKIKTQIAADQKLRNELYTILEDVGEISGLGNVIKRGFSTLTVPIFGDIGPFTEKSLALSNRAKAINPLIKKALATNPERLLKMEAEQLQDLTIDPNKLLTTPGVELAKIVRLITSLDNDINAQYYQINPTNEFRQMSFPNMGTKDDPLPAKALQFYAGEYFSMLPNGKLHVRVDDPNTGASTVKTVTKQQYEAGLRSQ